MSVAYRALYGVGFTPWEQMATLPGVTRQISALFDREEQGRQPPYGPALDLGCGSGIWAVKLAQRGWRVTGVDFVPKALRRARERADRAGVDVRLVDGDVTRLADSDVGAGFALLLDFGLFHDELTDGQREAMGREVTAVAAPDATMLLMAWAPGRRGPLPRGASRGDIEAAFPGWDVIGEEAFDVIGASFYRHMRKAEPRCYRLRQRSPRDAPCSVSPATHGLKLPYVEQGEQSGVPVLLLHPTPTRGDRSSACSRICPHRRSTPWP